MANIHPSAIVDPDARLHESVRVGPYTVIGPGVEIGEGCEIGPHVVLAGHTRIGSGCVISPFACLGQPPQDLGYKGEETRLEIGNNNVIRESVTINRGTVKGGGLTRVGDRNFIMAYCHIGHDCSVGHGNVFANNVKKYLILISLLHSKYQYLKTWEKLK